MTDDAKALDDRIQAQEATLAALLGAVQALACLVEQGITTQAQLIAEILRLKFELGYRDPLPTLKLIGAPARDVATTRPATRRPAG